MVPRLTVHTAWQVQQGSPKPRDSTGSGEPGPPQQHMWKKHESWTRVPGALCERFLVLGRRAVPIMPTNIPKGQARGPRLCEWRWDPPHSHREPRSHPVILPAWPSSIGTWRWPGPREAAGPVQLAQGHQWLRKQWAVGPAEAGSRTKARVLPRIEAPSFMVCQDGRRRKPSSGGRDVLQRLFPGELQLPLPSGEHALGTAAPGQACLPGSRGERRPPSPRVPPPCSLD